jgi:tetratricopeptide (TPR) repeat protein
MKKLLILLLTICICHTGFSQKKEKSGKETLLEELSVNVCKCIDSISVYNKSRDEVAKEINRCIDDQTGAYQMGAKMMGIDELAKNAEEKNGKKEITISINMDKSSKEYKEYYYEMERHLMSNCKSIKDKIAANDKQSEKSYSEDPKAVGFYTKGVEESKKENFKKAIDYFEKAVAIDPQFAFAWDNMGLCYRKMENYDKALESYKKSLEIDPKGLMPLQNIAIVYQYKKEYQLAIEAYEKITEIDKNNPEIYYGIGQIFALQLLDYEKGLSNMCKAYNLYIEQKSPYRTDAEKLISVIFAQMKKLGKEEKFYEILKENNISTK